MNIKIFAVLLILANPQWGINLPWWVFCLVFFNNFCEHFAHRAEWDLQKRQERAISSMAISLECMIPDGDD